MKRRLLIAVPVLILVAVVAWLLRPKHELVGEGYISERSITLWSSVAPVSYTHLDVYKRQILTIYMAPVLRICRRTSIAHIDGKGPESRIPQQFRVAYDCN